MTYIKYLFLVLFFGIFSLNIIAQTSSIDSLKTLLNKEGITDKEKLRLLHDISSNLYSIDIIKAIEYAKKTTSLSDSINFKEGLADGLLLLCQCYQANFNLPKSIECGEKGLKLFEELENKVQMETCYSIVGGSYLRQAAYKKALEYYQKALKLSIELGDKAETASCYNNIGVIYYQKGDIAETLAYFLKSLKIYEELENTQRISTINNNIGGIYHGQNDYKNALIYYKKSLKIAKELGDKKVITTSYNNIGGIYLLEGDPKNALLYLQQSLEIGKEIGDKRSISQSTSNIARIYKNEENYPLALEYYKNALELNISVGNKQRISSSYCELSEVYYKQGLIKKSYLFSNKAYAMANEIGNTEIIQRSSGIISSCCNKLGLYKDAYKYHVIYKNMHDSLYNAENIKEITNLENKYQFKKEKEAIKAEQDKNDAISAAEIKRQKQFRNFFIGGAFVFLLLAVIILRSLIHNRKANKILAQQKEKIQTQNNKLIELNSFKEGMTGMIVHDLKNPLNTIINIAKDERAKQSGKQMLNMVMNILDVSKYEQTKLIVDKDPYPLFNISQNAIAEVQFLMDQKNILITNNIKAQTGIKGDEKIIERIFINLLTNAIKHTPNNGTINLQDNNIGNGFIEIKVIDSGEGIPSDKLSLVFDKFGQITAKNSGNIQSTGLGLTFCKMAVEAHGGNIKVESKINDGTTFTFTLEATDDIVIEDKKYHNINNKSVLTLSETDKEKLKPYLENLQKLMVYESSKIKAILSEIDEQENQNILKWKDEVLQCLFAMNVEKYNELIKTNN